MNPNVVPAALMANEAKVQQLANVYKQIMASFGDFSMTTLHLSTTALASSSTNDKTYAQIETKLLGLNTQRDNLALQISTALESAEFSGQPISNSLASQLIGKANGLLQKAH